MLEEGCTGTCDRLTYLGEWEGIDGRLNISAIE
jgi:hypothetical protein